MRHGRMIPDTTQAARQRRGLGPARCVAGRLRENARLSLGQVPNLMNLHEYQSKEALRRLRHSRCRAGAVAATAGRGGRGGAGARRHGLGGQGPGARGRPRQGRRRQARARPRRRSRSAAAGMLGTAPGHQADRPRGPADRTRSTSRPAREIARELYLSLLAEPREGPHRRHRLRPPAAWTSRKSPRTTPEKILTVDIHPAAGLQPYQCRAAGFRAGLQRTRRSTQFAAIAHGALQAVHRAATPAWSRSIR